MSAPEKFAKERKAFKYQGRTVYEWDQSIDEVNVYVQPPPGVTSSIIACDIQPTHFKLGIKGNPPFLDEDLFSKCKKSDSFWTIEDGEIHITFAKVVKSEPWPCVFKRHSGDAGGGLNYLEHEQVKKRMLLERFQEEYGGFDFSGAEVGGAAPDPTTFLRDLDDPDRQPPDHEPPHP